MNFSVDPIWPWPVLLLAVAAMFATVAVGYPRRVRQLSKPWQRTLLFLRLAIALLLMLWMLRPTFAVDRQDKSSAVLYVLADISRSMETPDGPGGVTRLEAMRELLQKAEPLLERLSDQVEIRTRVFADEMSAAANLPDKVEGRSTAIGWTLQALADESRSDRVAGILMLADGKQTSTGRQDINPVQPAKILGRQHSPIYGVVFGSGEITGNSLDVAVSELDVSRDVFVRNVVPLRVRLKSLGIAGREVTVRVLIEDSLVQQDGTSGTMQPIPRDQQNRTLLVHTAKTQADDTVLDLQFVPQHDGELKLRVEAVPLSDEVRKTNNAVETIIRVRQGGIRVAYFDTIRPEQHWLNRIAVSSRIQLDFQPIRKGRFADRNQFDDEWFKPGNYDAFIIGDVPAAIFGPERLAAIRRCCDAGAGLMMTGGYDNFGAGGYHRTPLANLLPVAMTDADEQLNDPIQMLPTALGRTSSMLQIASPEMNRQRWEQLPPLSGATLLLPKQASLAQVLAESPQGIPLLIGQNVGGSRVLAFAGDTTWQWYVHEDWGAEAYQRFWRQVIFWITKKDDDSNSPVWVNVEPRDLMPGRSAQLMFGARNADGLPLTDAVYDVSVVLPDGSREQLPARSVNGQGEADFESTTLPGDYWAYVTASVGGQPVGSRAATRFLVNERDPELDNPAANPGLMRELAHSSGGDFLTPDALLERLQQWADNGLPSLALTRSQRISLWDNWYTLLLFVLLLTAEWAIRKKRGLV
ncbi:MAG: glutamine amidotransferase [Planctomycetaceae bacterium]